MPPHSRRSQPIHAPRSVVAPLTPPPIAASEGAVPLEGLSPLSLLLSRHLFHEGEIIELAIRPSSWWIILTSWRTLLVAAIIFLSGIVFGDSLPGSRRYYLEIGLMVGLARLMWATIRWMSRIHILTNVRVITISGVFNVTVVECPLRRLARVREISSLLEKAILLGTIELIPIDESFPISLWQTIRRPAEVLVKIRSSMHKAQQSGTG